MNLCATVLLTALVGSHAEADDQVAFGNSQVLSQEIAGGAQPGGAASKGKLVRLIKTPMNIHDGRLITVYADDNTTGEVWEPKGGQHRAKDIFARYSDDGGTTWSAPVNLSNTADKSSAMSDWDGDGVDEVYWGHSQKPNIFNSGDVIVVSWIDAYLPESTWTWGTSGVSAVQGSVLYPDLTVYPEQREVPYHGVYVAASFDGGETWEYGANQPPIQLTYGRRDAKQDVNRGAGKKWLVTWQEDPEGLQQGEADGPGDGSSGATAKKGTDIWYTYVADITTNALALRANRVPLSDHTSYDLTGTNGFPMSGQAGDVNNHAATRANTHIVNDGGVFTTMVAYEQTKGENGVLEGKTIQYHSFPYDQPPVSGALNATHGAAGATLTSILTNSRRVRFVRQTPNGTDPGLFIFWREGVGTEGASADAFGKVSLALDEASVAAAPTLNLSTNTPEAVPADLLLDSEADPLENALAHRAIMRGSFITIGYSYTWNGPLQRLTDTANLDFWVRSSYDGGATWTAPRNLSNLNTTQVNVKEPRLVYTANTGTQDDNVFLAAWGTETNVYEGVSLPESLDVVFTRSTDLGASYEKVVPIAASPSGDFESQLRVNDDGSEVYVVVMSADSDGTEVVYSRGHALDVSPSLGTLGCFGDALVADCPCGNASMGGVAAGCLNSTSEGGLLVAAGSASLADQNLSMAVSGLPASTWTLMARSARYDDILSGAEFGSGLLCLGAPITRLSSIGTNAQGEAGYGLEARLTSQLNAGDKAVYQVLYRDAAAPCGASSAFNSTNTVEIEFQP